MWVGEGEVMKDFVNQISRVAATFQPERGKDSGTNRTGFVKLSKATKAASKAIGCSFIGTQQQIFIVYCFN
jgi:hypothetical protein